MRSPQFSKKSLFSKNSVCMKRKQRASALQLLMYSDKDQFYVCIVGVPLLETDKTLLIVFSSPFAQRCTVFQQKWKTFLAGISSSRVIMSLFSGLMSPNQTETANYSLLDRWAALYSRARTISRPWLDSLTLERVAACSRCGSQSRHGDSGDCGHWGLGHHFPGLLRCPGGGVQTPLLPPAPPAAPLRLQVSETIRSFLICIWQF